jgi:hypothetical protein
MSNRLRDFLMTRRRLVWASAAAAGAGALGATWIAASSPKDLVFALMQRALPGALLDRDSVGLCAQDVVAQILAQTHSSPMQRASSVVKLKGVRALSQAMGVGPVATSGPFAERLEEIARVAITQLLTHSNFFAVADPTAETIYYFPPAPDSACGNPFADVSPPA